MIEDTSAVYWRTNDNNIFVLRVKLFNEYVDSLNSDFTGTKISKGNYQFYRDFPHNNKALLLSPSYYDFASQAPSLEKKDINYYFKEKLESKGFDVSYLTNENQ